MPDASIGVDFDSFRARHRAWRPLLDRLVQERIVSHRQNRYFLTLSAIAFVNSPSSVQFLDDADALYREIQAKYEANPEREIGLAELATVTGLEEHRARQLLSYMFECNVWLQSQPLDILTNPTATIRARDGVLDFDDFRAVVRKYDEWRLMPPYGAIQVDLAGMVEEEAQSRQAAAARALFQPPIWMSSLPPAIREVMTEVYAARDICLRTLPAIGMRTALDLLFADVLASDAGTFKSKVDKFKNQGLITVAEEAQLLAAIDGGNASAHRGFVPDDEDLTTMLEITNRLLQAQYVLPAASNRLKANTPARS